MTDTNLTQRNNADWHDKTLSLVQQAYRAYAKAEKIGCPSAGRKWREWKQIAARYGDGETLTPRF